MATGKYVKYPRTPLLPWSPKKDDDDFRVVDCSAFEGGGGRRPKDLVLRSDLADE